MFQEIGASIADPATRAHFETYLSLWNTAEEMAAEAAEKALRRTARWKCSEQLIRNMIKRGNLPHSLLGEKLIRISREDVEAFERSGGTPSRKWASSAAIHNVAGQQNLTLRRRRKRIPPLGSAKYQAEDSRLTRGWGVWLRIAGFCYMSRRLRAQDSRLKMA